MKKEQKFTYDSEEARSIMAKTKELSEEYPMIAAYDSRQSLWARGLNAGVLSQELYDMAKEYYGKLWNYSGD